MKRHVDMVSGGARGTPAGTAVVSPERRLTFAELDDRTGRLGSALRALGLVPGDRVALLAANELECVEIQAACARSGFTLVPLNTRLAERELAYILGDAAPAVLIAGREEHERVQRLSAGADTRGPVGLGPGDGGLDPYDELLAAAEPDPEADPLDPALMTTFLYTSGTTGRPKGAMIDRRGFTARVFVNVVELGVAPDDVFVQCLPMFHIAAFLCYAYLFRGASVVMLPRFTPPDALETLQRERATSTVLVPTMIAVLLEDPAIEPFDASSLRLIVYGGASIDPPLLRRAIARFGCGFHQQYGMTEAGAASILRPEDHDPEDEEKLASAGTEAIGFDVRVVDDDDRPVPDGGIGEIVFRGPAVMSGYWNLPEVSAETLRGGWMHSGDLGYRDGRGYLHVVDRRGDMIISGGENVYPREIEMVLAEHPVVKAYAIIGLPDPIWGQVVTGVIAGDAPPDEELATWLRERIAGYKVPRRWIHVDELPRGATGKILKAQLRADLAAPPA